MRIGQIDFPRELIDAQAEKNLVIFAGAGVSMPHPSNYPNFRDLANKIAEGKSTKRKMGEPFDQFLGRLNDEGVKVHEITRDLLSDPNSNPNRLHSSILKLFPDTVNTRIVTTNFDTHFSKVIDNKTKIYSAPALPLGNNFRGLVHLHGSVVDDIDHLILTDHDFGRAYLTEGWASRFLQEMYAKYTVLFIGYSHNDPIMNYLTRGYHLIRLTAYLHLFQKTM
ncbi:MAG: SIR2 family protein [bacterium]|nr:SIR2 family protein [bacterium]